MAISSDGEYICIGSTSGVHLFQRDPEYPLWDFLSPVNIDYVDISGDGKWIAAATNNGSLYLFNRNSSIPLHTHHLDTLINDLSITKNGMFVAVADGEEHILMFNFIHSAPIWNVTTDGNVLSVRTSSDSAVVGAGTENGVIYLLNTINGSLHRHFQIDSSPILDVALSSEGEWLIAATNSNILGFNRFADLDKSVWQISNVEAHAVVFGADYVVVGTNQGQALLLAANSGVVLWCFPVNSSSFPALVAISENGQYVAVNIEKIYFLRTNTAPKVTGGVVPLVGGLGSIYEFWFNYTDAENQEPQEISVVIDNHAWSMTKLNSADFNFYDGCLYIFHTLLSPGFHNYYFFCTDGLESTRWPENSSAFGPTSLLLPGLELSFIVMGICVPTAFLLCIMILFIRSKKPITRRK